MNPHTIISNNGDGNSDKCGSTGVPCYGLKYECYDGFWPRIINECSVEDGTGILNLQTGDEYCSSSGAESCKVYHSPPGCDQCQTGTFKKSYNHPCKDCQEIFGPACLGCNDVNGCCQCKNGFGLLWSSENLMWFCHPTPCLNLDYNCQVCNWTPDHTFCSQCKQGFNRRVQYEYCI